MIRFKVIGAGAAGNKALITLINRGFDADRAIFLNSTNKDLPEEYKTYCHLFGSGLGGCGKERKLGKKMILADMKSNAINFDSFVDPDDQAIVIVASTEGGSGSAALPVLAKYYKEVHGMNVICVLLFGFQDDIRGLQNSIELCQELSDEYTIVGISNASFLAKCNGNKFKAEKAANEYFAKLIEIIAGRTIKPGSQVIDDTDLYKVVTTPGYLMADELYLNSSPTSIDQFNSIIKSGVRQSGFVQPPANAGVKREALIFTVPFEDDFIDYSCMGINELYGLPYEKFTNLAVEPNSKITFGYILSGMKLPIDELTALYNGYIENTQKVDKTEDAFSKLVGDMRGDAADSQFDMLTSSKPSTISKNSFFDSFEESPVEEKKTQKKKVIETDEY